MGGVDPVQTHCRKPVVDHGAHGFGGVTPAPVRLADPIGQFGRFAPVIQVEGDCTEKGLVPGQSNGEVGQFSRVRLAPA